MPNKISRKKLLCAATVAGVITAGALVAAPSSQAGVKESDPFRIYSYNKQDPGNHPDCIDVLRAGSDPGTPVISYPCWKTDGQRFTLIDHDHGYQANGGTTVLQQSGLIKSFTGKCITPDTLDGTL